MAKIAIPTYRNVNGGFYTHAENGIGEKIKKLYVLFRKLKRKVFRRLMKVYLNDNMPHSMSAMIDDVKVTMPFPMTVTIDDVGRRDSWRADQSQHVLDDYENLAYIGKNVGTRLMCAFMIAYFDKTNICAKYPTTTQYGKNWDNTKNINIQDEIMRYIQDNSAYMEYGLHGVDHRMFWDERLVPDGFGGANKDLFGHHGEWYDVGGVKPWNVIAVQEHIRAFNEISKQYGFSFPRSMVPPHHAYYYNPTSDESTSSLLNRCGLKYVTTDFYAIAELHPKEGIDHGILLTHRDFGNLPHDAIGTVIDELVGTTSVMTHFANFYAESPTDNRIVAEKWIDWFNTKVKDDPLRYVPKNNAQLNSQWLYCKYSTMCADGGAILIDSSMIPVDAYDYGFIGNLVLKIPLLEGQHVSDAMIDGGQIAGYYEDRGYGHVILPRLDRSVHKLHLMVGSFCMPVYLLNDGTYNAFSFKSTENECVIELEMYGSQNLKVKIPFEPIKVLSTNPNVRIQSYDYKSKEGMFVVGLTATDVQGEVTTITISG